MSVSTCTSTPCFKPRINFSTLSSPFTTFCLTLQHTLRLHNPPDETRGISCAPAANGHSAHGTRRDRQSKRNPQHLEPHLYHSTDQILPLELTRTLRHSIFSSLSHPYFSIPGLVLIFPLNMRTDQRVHKDKPKHSVV